MSSCPVRGKSPGANRPPLASTAARLFFPQSQRLSIDLLSLSPGLLKKVVYAGSNAGSFEQGSQFLLYLAEQHIPASLVRRTTERIGAERLAQRDLAVESFQRLPLGQRNLAPCTAPELGVAMTDGARMQIRSPAPSEAAATPLATATGSTAQSTPAPLPAASSGQAEEALEPEVLDEEERKERHWREDKVGLLMTMKSEIHQADPCPELPEVFREPLVVLKLAREIGLEQAVPDPGPFCSAAQEKEAAEPPSLTDEAVGRTKKRPGCPEVQSRRVVATRQRNPHFGPILAAAAWSMGLLAAPRGAYVGDGSSANWSIHQKYFPRYTPIVDFIHVLSYVFAAALAGRDFAAGWEVYQHWIEWVWQGKVEQVLAALRQRREELPEGSAERGGVEKSLTYLENQKGRMAYAEYRRQGLPIMSSYIESAVKQVGRRVKGTEKFWSEQGAEAVLQLRADYLSDDDPLDHFWEQRARRMTGQRNYKRRSA